MKKLGTDEQTLRVREALVSCEGILACRGAPFEYCGEVAVPVVEVSQRFGNQRVGLVRGHCEDAVDAVIGAGLVDGMQVSGFARRPERPDDDARRVGPQVKRLPVAEGPGWRSPVRRSDEHTSDLPSLMRTPSPVFRLKTT